MCGRVVQSASGEELAEIFGLEETPEVSPRYNVPPGDLITVVHASGPRRRADRAHWGHRRGKDGRFLFLLRSERSAPDRGPFQGDPCVVPVDGFFEWKHVGRLKQPYLFTWRDRRVFPLAGIWQAPRDKGDPLGTCVLLTQEASPTVRPVHDRMPVVLEGDEAFRWLEGAPLSALHLAAAGNPDLSVTPVSPRMNRTTVDEPGCLEPVAPSEPPQRTLF